ncbi:MAG: CotH kinase family protein, partial [Akkermansiaceae bacterium]|nr:CotH kinase family protein [Akkermansiaceae bacterium]
MPVAEANAMHALTEVMSNDRLPCTVIHNEQEIYYGCKVRLKSSQRARFSEVRIGFNLKFPPDHKFLGCHGSVVFDRSFGEEIIVKHLAAQVGGVPAMFDDLAWVVQPRANRADAGILLKSRFDGEWLDNQFPDGGDGSMYEYELIYYPFTTTGGPEGLKLPQPDGVSAVAMRNQGGDDKELYRWHWLAKNNRDADDYSGIINVLDTMGLTGAEYSAGIGDAIDVDQWLRVFAFLHLTGIGDSYGTWASGAWHNAKFYLRTTDQRAMFFPWDVDQVFTRGVTSGVTSSPDLNKLIGVSPANERAYYGHLLDMIESKFNSGYMQQWLDHYSQFLRGENIANRSAYINARGNHVRSLINAAVAAIPYRVTTRGGGRTPDSTTTVSGDGWVDVRELRLAGTQAPLAVSWVDDNRWELTLPVAPGANSYTIEALGFDGSVIGSDTFSITGTGSLVPADATNLVISEIHYHPLAPEGDEVAAGFTDGAMFEWVELLSLSESSTLDLGNISFDAGIALVIPPGTTLAPGGRLVVPANAAAFTHRYGALATGELLALSFLGDDGSNKLSNSGERVELSSAANERIAEFSYDDSRPWPISADGDGYSLTLMCAGRNEPSLPESWRSSAAPGGSPGTHDALPLAEWVSANSVADLYGDTDLDGIENLIEYLAGSDPNQPNGLALSVGLGSGDEVRLEFRQRIGADEADMLAVRS